MRIPEQESDSHSTTSDAVIADLQSRLAFQEDALQALNRVIAEQDAEMARVQRQVQHLNEKLNELAGAVEQSSAAGEEQPPPHY